MLPKKDMRKVVMVCRRWKRVGEDHQLWTLGQYPSTVRRGVYREGKQAAETLARSVSPTEAFEVRSLSAHNDYLQEEEFV